MLNSLARATCFLVCIGVAGIFGGITVTRRIA
jgi:hypothetical protein